MAGLAEFQRNAHVLEMRKLAVAEKQIEAGAFLPDQEIRARALEMAVQLLVAGIEKPDDDRGALPLAHDFEAYIRDGVT